MLGLKSPTMLYRKGTQERIHGVHVDWTIVDESQVDNYLDDGWYRTPNEAGLEKHDQNSRVALNDQINERIDMLEAEHRRLDRLREDLEKRQEALERAEAEQRQARRAEAERAEEQARLNEERAAQARQNEERAAQTQKAATKKGAESEKS